LDKFSVKATLIGSNVVQKWRQMELDEMSEEGMVEWCLICPREIPGPEQVERENEECSN